MKENVFESEHIERSIFRLAFPSVMSSLITIIYNLTDMFFIGQTGDANQVAAIALCMPVFLILMALGGIFGIGGSSLISRLLGKKNYYSIKVASSLCCYLIIIAGFIYNFIIVAFMPTVLHLMGTTPLTQELARSYLLSVSFGAYFVIFTMAFSNILRSEGASKEAMHGILIGNLINIILDPLFILYFNLGVLGAGIATVIGNIVSTLFFIRYILRNKKTNLSINFKYCKFRKAILFEVLTVGFPASLGGTLMSMAHIFLNNFLVKYGEVAIASMGIAGRAFSVMPIIQMGFSHGVQPLVGYNYAALKHEKMHKVILKALKISFILGILLSSLFIIFSYDIARFFINDNEVLKLAPKFIKIIAITGPFVGLFFVFVVVFQSIGKAWPSLVLSTSRQGLVYIPALFISDYFFKLGGVVCAQPLSDFFAFSLAFIIFLKIKELRKR